MTEENHKESIWRRFKSLFGGKQQETVRETIEDLIEEANSEGDCPFSEHEQLLLNNILYLKDKKCCHAMIPRANIIAFHKDGTVRELAELNPPVGVFFESESIFSLNDDSQMALSFQATMAEEESISSTWLNVCLKGKAT